MELYTVISEGDKYSLITKEGKEIICILTSVLKQLDGYSETKTSS